MTLLLSVCWGCPSDPSLPTNTSASALAPSAHHLDVRTRHEFRTGHIPGAKNIPLDELAGRLGELHAWKDGEIVTVCQVGQRSARAAKLLGERGFRQVRNLTGGMKAWSKEVNGERLDRIDPQAYRAAYHLGAVLVRLVRSEGPYGSPGLLVRTVFPGGPTAKVLRVGDLITAVAGVTLTSERVRTARYRDLFRLNEKVKLEVTRAGKSRSLVVTMREHTVPARAQAPAAGESPSGVLLPADLKARSSVAALDAVVKAGALDRAAWEPTLLPGGVRVHRDLVKGFGVWPSTKGIPPASDVIAQARLALEHAGRSFQVELSDRGIEDEGPARAHEEQLARLVRFAMRAQAVRQTSRSTPAASAARLAETVIVHDLEEHAGAIALHAQRYRGGDWSEPIALAYQGLSRVAEALTMSRSTVAKARAPGVEGEVVAWRDTPLGPVVIGGAKNNRYRGRFAAIVDLGGDDEYLDLPASGPAVLVDLAGNDRYRLAPPAGVLGSVQVWFDKAGDDRYETTTFGLGGAFHGVQLLLDQAGNDSYTARSLSLGAAMFGIGILVDGSGNDRYRASRAAMGFGGVYGVGVLIDSAGSDVYEAVALPDAAQKMPHSNASMMQGCGMGIRELSYGGLGMLIDRAGDDRYAAKEYAQGVGYLGGVGVLLDHAGKDRYRGVKFAQAAGVHAGIGVLRDGAGDDEYVLTGLQGQAAAWDLGVALLEDDGGRDVFRAPRRAQAFAANNGLAVMRVKGTKPSLVCDEPTTCGGHAGPNDYAGGRGAKSIAVVTPLVP